MFDFGNNNGRCTVRDFSTLFPVVKIIILLYAVIGEQ